MKFDVSKGCSHSKALYLEHVPDGTVIELIIGCKSRFASFCPECAEQWKKTTRARYADGIDAMVSPKLLTLTLRKYGSLETDIKRIWTMRKALFKRIRREGYKIRSWCGVVELPNHVHLVIDSDYIPQHEISTWWNDITHDSYVVDIRPVYRKKKALRYITSYLTKASQWDGLNLDLFKGFHLIGSDGLCLMPFLGSMLCPYCGCGGSWRITSLEHYAAVDDYNSRRPPPLNAA